MKYILMFAAVILWFIGDLAWSFSQLCLGALQAVVHDLEERREEEIAEARLAREGAER